MSFATKPNSSMEDGSHGETKSAVVARGLNFAYGEGELRKQILFEISFEISHGEIVLMTGPSGSGKTTLLTLLGALRHVQEGELHVLGEPLHQCDGGQLAAVRRRVGFIFQQHNLLDFLTARQNVELAFQLHTEVSPGEAKSRSQGMLEHVGLGERLDYLPSRLSGGQRQRVSVARALAPRPQLILADEPTAALDSVSGREVVQTLQTLAREQGCPVLIVTHDGRIMNIADRILTIEDGRLREESRSA